MAQYRTSKKHDIKEDEIVTKTTWANGRWDVTHTPPKLTKTYPVVGGGSVTVDRETGEVLKETKRNTMRAENERKTVNDVERAYATYKRSYKNVFDGSKDERHIVLTYRGLASEITPERLTKDCKIFLDGLARFSAELDKDNSSVKIGAYRQYAQGSDGRLHIHIVVKNFTDRRFKYAKFHQLWPHGTAWIVRIKSIKRLIQYLFRKAHQGNPELYPKGMQLFRSFGSIEKGKKTRVMYGELSEDIKNSRQVGMGITRTIIVNGRVVTTVTRENYVKNENSEDKM